MLHAAWEAVAGAFVNASTGREALDSLGVLLRTEDAASVVIARDTRTSSPALSELLATGVRDAGGVVIDLGVATTPQLHFAVRSRCRAEPCEISDYYAGLATAMRDTVPKNPQIPPAIVDCANGVGAKAMRALQEELSSIDMVLVNADTGKDSAPLNEMCGADYVQKSRTMPKVYDDGFATTDEPGASAMWASLDGDADRLVCYISDDDGNFILADGDRFAALVASQVAYALRGAGVSASVGVGQTAYSNGAATEFLQGLPGVEVVMAKTGVKHLEKAVAKFDIGVYWEPNGHGTVLFNDAVRARIAEVKGKIDGEGADDAQYLDCIGRLANQAVGDGVADLLLVLGIMARRELSFRDWVGLYSERATANGIVRVQDKSVVQTEDFDRAVVAPSALRAAISRVSGGSVRAFVRPSGTEDVVRVFAEAEDENTANETLRLVSQAVYDTCGGVGERAN